MKSMLARSTALIMPLMLATGALAQTATPAAPQNAAPASAMMAPPASSAMAPQGSAKLSKVDQEFVTKAAQGGLAEVQMAQLAQQKGGDGVKTFAQAMITDHTPANDKLAKLATSKGMTAPTDPSAAQQKMLAKLQGLSGDKFDKTYISGQVRAHEAMLKLFERESTNGKDADLKAFADSTVPVIQKHITMAQNIKG